jgi:hypothetical protein
LRHVQGIVGFHQNEKSLFDRWNIPVIRYGQLRAADRREISAPFVVVASDEHFVLRQ